MTIDGCPADCADGQAEASLFSAGFEAAIGIQVGVAADNVEVTSVTVTSTAGTVKGLPSLTVLFVLKNVDDSNQKTVQKGLSNKDTAAAVGKALQGGGKGPCPKAQVRGTDRLTSHSHNYSLTVAEFHISDTHPDRSPSHPFAQVGTAASGVATVEITQEPVIEAQQPISGVTFQQAQGDAFQGAFQDAVATRLGVDHDNIVITGVTQDGPNGAMVMGYQVQGLDTPDMADTEHALESNAMAKDIAAGLQDAGFKKAGIVTLTCTSPTLL